MLPAILGAVGSIAGGLLGNKSAKAAAKANTAAQIKVMKNQLQWKAADAEKAGISKIFAMGAPTQSFAPTSVGGNFDFLGGAGQNIGRAMQAGQSDPQQTSAIGKQAAAVQLEGLALDNDIKRAQLTSLVRTNTQPGSPPGIPAPNTVHFMPSQGDAAQGETDVKTKIDTASAIDPSATPGVTPEVMLTRTNTGGYSLALPPALQEAYESMGAWPRWQWSYRNLVRPYFDKSSRPKELTERAGKQLQFNPFTGEYHYVPKHRIVPRGQGTYRR